MTTIATDGKTMSGDGQQTMCGTVVSNSYEKIWRLADGSLFGSCGSACDGIKFSGWLDGGARGDPPKLEDDFACLVLSRDGTLRQCGDSAHLVEIKAPAAIGSGMDIAIGAMDAGKNAAEAVAIASRRNPHTGGVIMSLDLEPALALVAGSEAA